MKNKAIFALFALFAISIAAFAGVSYAYRGDSDAVGPNYDADVHEKLEAAIEAKDYDAWIKIRQENNLPITGRMFQAINKDNFEKYAELHNANLAGDTTKADSIRSELGLGQGLMKRGSGQGRMIREPGSGSQRNFVDENGDGVCDLCGR